MLLGFCPEIDFTRSLLKHLVGNYDKTYFF